MEYGKYVIVEEKGCELAILFDPILQHNVVANGFKVLSAGFFSSCAENKDIDVGVWGVSTSLNIGSREIDPLIIKRVLIGRN